MKHSKWELFLMGITLILLIIFLNSCKSAKPKIAQSIVHDSVYIDRTITQIKEVKDTLTIENPCDSNGVLKAFDYSNNSEGAKIQIVSDGTKIIQKVYIPKIEYKDSIVTKIQQKTITKEIKVKNPINTFLLYTCLILGGIIIIGLILKRIIP